MKHLTILSQKFFVLLIIASLIQVPVSGEPRGAELERAGNLLLLQGDFAGAAAIETQLIDAFDEPVGHIFALNTIITHLSWDETETRYDEALQAHAEATLDWCNQRLLNDETDVTANYYCGQTHFALSYFNGLKGNYFQAGKHGTNCIEHLEQALRYDPGLIDAKMHLGVAYHVADNLPAFIRMFSRLLWFIPSGNSEKSLPYLIEVIEDGDLYPDVARYIYSTLLLENPALRPEAEQQLRKLVSLYPQNRRFQLRLISVLMIQQDYEGTLAAAGDYLAGENAVREPDASLARIWLARAYLGLSQPNDAARVFAEIAPVFHESQTDVPGWSRAWYMLTDAQLHDLANRRREAQIIYADIIRLAGSTYVNDTIVEAARDGLVKPFSTLHP